LASHGSSFQKVFLGAAGSSAGGAGLDVDEVFSTFLYEGAGGTGVTVNNGVDLSGEGGLVWIKAREATEDHVLFDTERGVTKLLESNKTTAEQTNSGTLTNFYSTGFRVDGNGTVGSSGDDYVSWTFRKAPKFFDVVTYTGNGSNRTIAHNLGTTVGMMLVKLTSDTDGWAVYHRGLDSSAPEDYRLRLDGTNTKIDNTDGSRWNRTAPTSSVFSLGTDGSVNANGSTYVAYLFAHNDGDGTFGPDGNADIISCGSVNANSTFTLPWQPQWILSKDYNRSYDWHIIDSMRGFTASGNADNYLEANNTNAEQTAGWFDIDGNTLKNRSGGNIIYVAIRRGPLTVPTDATKVFDVEYGPSSGVYSLSTGFPVDMAITKDDTGGGNILRTRLLGGGTALQTESTNAEGSSTTTYWDSNTSFDLNLNANYSSFINWMWKRAPSYFDVVAYTGNGTRGRTVSHNLGVIPEMMWIKNRGDAQNWLIYIHSLGGTKRLFLNLTSGVSDASIDDFNNTDAQATQFTLGNDGRCNANNQTFIAYLFATAAGVSKVGSYTGNGSTQNIDCGFSNGARFVLIKITSSTGDWRLYDTVRGIVAGDDPQLVLNNTSAELSSGYDLIDPHSSGFALPASPYTNNSGASYIFYAIA